MSILRKKHKRACSLLPATLLEYFKMIKVEVVFDSDSMYVNGKEISVDDTLCVLGEDGGVVFRSYLFEEIVKYCLEN